MKKRQKKKPVMVIEERYEIKYLGIGMEYVSVLIPSVPMYSPMKTVPRIKGNRGKPVIEAPPEVKKQVWGGEDRSDGYFVSTVST
jgi:REP element-mobilizing transposase RayT